MPTTELDDLFHHLAATGEKLIIFHSAAAQGTVAQREGCEGDAFKFCSNFIPFVHAIENCLHQNMRRLTPACRVQMQGGTASRRR